MVGAAATRGLWRAPHLSLFLLAALWAALVPLVWLVPGLSCDPVACDPVAWHRQELMLGFAGAAVGGYLLTALPHWLNEAGRGSAGRGLTPAATRLLVLAWALGRLSGAPFVPDGPALAGLCLYPLGLASCLVVPLAKAQVWSRLPIALAPLLLGLIAFRLRLASDGLSAVLGMALLVALVGGRLVPAFLAARAVPPAGVRRAPLPLAGRLANLTLCLALAAHLAGLDQRWTGGLLLAAAAGQALRLRDWPLARGLAGGQADLALLLIAWLWLPLGLALAGAGLVGAPGLALADALHALSMGLMGSMILAVIARAAMRRVPGALRPGPAVSVAFALVLLATILRLLPTDGPGLLAVAALCWSAGWAITAGLAAAAATRPLPHPVLSARRDAGQRKPG